MEFVRKNKYTIIVVIIFILLIIVGICIKNTFFPNLGKALYGDRLDGIEEVEIKDQKLEQVIGTFQDKDFVEEATQDVKGKLVTFVVTVKDDVEVSTAKGLTTVLKEGFDEEQLAFYDFQLMIKKNGQDEKFPIIGYKHHSSSDFTFTKDR